MKINTNNSELKRISAIQSKTFMKNYILVLDLYLSKYGVIKTFNYLSEILKKFKTPKNSQNYYIQIYMIEYLFLKSKENGIARSNIFITTNTKDKKFIDYTTIIVDGETQKPDMDLIIYSLKNDNKLNNIMIISLKTSLRERAGQTYKWKLLMEIASGNNSIKDKYNITYNPPKMPLVCFATINFYNEINNPQHKGMFKFFDNSFIGKPLTEKFINNLEKIVSYANENL